MTNAPDTLTTAPKQPQAAEQTGGQLTPTPAGGFFPRQPDLPRRNTSVDAWGAMALYADAPQIRNGKLTSSSEISVKTMLKMWDDELISFLMSYLSVLLAGSEYEIICEDPQQRRFFEAMYADMHRPLMLKSAPALFFGYQGLVKEYAFKVPMPIKNPTPKPKAKPGFEPPVENPDDGPIWNGSVDPLIINDFVQLHPSRCYPTFDQNGRKFVGITVDGLGDPVPPLFAFWITTGQWRSFGDYRGYGRARSCYEPWWRKHFTIDQRTLFVQRGVDPVVKARFPSGSTGDYDHRDVAQNMGDDVRGGATVALPSELYANVTGGGYTEELTNIYQWDIEYLINTADPGPFTEIKFDEDKSIAMGMFIPPQAVLEAQQMGLGGPNTAEVMSELGERILIQDAVDIDRHINDYLFPTIASANFGPAAKPVRKVTKGLNAVTRFHLQDVMNTMLSRSDTDATVVDMGRILDRLDIPTKPAEPKPTVPLGPDGLPLPSVPAGPGSGPGSDSGSTFNDQKSNSQKKDNQA